MCSWTPGLPSHVRGMDNAVGWHPYAWSARKYRRRYPALSGIGLLKDMPWLCGAGT